MDKIAENCGRVVVVLCTLMAWTGAGCAQEVRWVADYDAARWEAAKTGRPLVIDLGTTNCLYCKKLDAITFSDAAVIKQLNDQFVAVKIDADRDDRLVRALNIQSYPTLVFAASDGKILGVHEGFVDAAKFRQQLQRALSEAGESPVKPEPAVDGSRSLAGATVRTTVPPLEPASERAPDRIVLARRLLAQAIEDERLQQYVCCLERCQSLMTSFADLPEAADARRLAAKIKSDPELSRRLCDHLSEQLGDLYLGLAEGCQRRQQPQQARSYLERLVQLCPDSHQAITAKQRLKQLQDGQVAGTEPQAPQLKVRAQAP